MQVDAPTPQPPGLTWLSSAPPGGSASLSGACAWASRTGASDAPAPAPAAGSPSHCTWGPAPCGGGCRGHHWAAEAGLALPRERAGGEHSVLALPTPSTPLGQVTGAAPGRQEGR